MTIKNSLTAAAALCIVAASVLVVAAPAQAAPSIEDYYAAAQAAADGADEAFLDADWAEVLVEADAFDAAYAAFQAQLGLLFAAVDASEAALKGANATHADALAAWQALEDKRAAVDAAALELNNAKSVLFQQTQEYNAAVAALAATPAFLPGCPPETIPCEIIPVPNEGYPVAQFAVYQANFYLNEATNWVAFATAALDQATLALPEDGGAAIETALDHAITDRLAALNLVTWAIDDWNSGLSLRFTLEGDLRRVSDRRADLADLEHIRSVVVWTLGADNDKVHAGDLVKLNFTVPNSELLPLTDAEVSVEAPGGVVPSCDIVDGYVAAGQVVHCTAAYTPTAADAAAGGVTFEVLLRGYLQLGPGNPRANALSRTYFETTQTMRVAVVPAAVVPDEPTATDELAETGLNSFQAPLAAGLVVAGIGLLVLRRRLDA